MSEIVSIFASCRSISVLRSYNKFSQKRAHPVDETECENESERKKSEIEMKNVHEIKCIFMKLSAPFHFTIQALITMAMARERTHFHFNK